MVRNNTICIGILLIFLYLVTISQQAVVNDVCANAIDLSSQADEDIYYIDNSEANIPSDSPALSCGVRPTRDMWFKFNSNIRSTEKYIVTISLCSSTIDTVIQVFAGDCNNPICLTSNDDSSECSTQSRSSVTFATSANTVYYFTVGGLYDEVGTIAIQLIRNNNNACSKAAPLILPAVVNAKIKSTSKVTSVNRSFTCNGVAVTTTGSWYQFNSGNQTKVSISLCNIASDFNSVLLLIKADSCNNFVSSNCYYNDDNPIYCGSGSLGSYLSDVDVTVNTNYFIFVSGNENSVTRAFELKINSGNDNCISARSLGAITTTATQFSGHTTNATYDAPAYLCPNYPQYQNNVWYSFTVTSSNTVEIYIDTTTFDSYIQVFKSTNCAFTSSSCVIYGDNRNNRDSDVFFPVTAGTYYFSVSSVYGSTGYFNGYIRLMGNSKTGGARIPQSGDNCSSAIELVFPLSGATNGKVIVQGNTYLAKSADIACAFGNIDLYYYFTLPDSATYFSIDVCSFTATVPYLNVFRLSGSTGCPTSSTPCFGSGIAVPGLCGNQMGGVRFTSMGNLPNTRFLFAVSFPGTSSDGQPFNLTLSVVPPNDQCNNQIPLPVGTTLTRQMTKYASPEPNLPACGDNTQSGDVWYTLNPGNNNIVSVSISGNTFDTALQVFSGSCGSLTCLSFNDNYNSPSSTVTFSTSRNTDYSIAVRGGGTQYGEFSISASAVTTPAINSNIIYALSVDTTSPKPITLGSHNFLQPNGPTPNPNCGEGTAANGVWFKFNSDSSTSATISLCGSTFNPKFRVFTGSTSSPSCFPPASTAPAATAPCGSPYLLTGLTVNTVYYVLVFGSTSSAVGNIALTVTLSPPVNDNFNNAIPITLATSTVSGSTVYATPDNIVLCGKEPIFSKNVWYVYDNSILKKTKMTLTLSASFDSFLQLYSYANNQLTCIKSNDGTGTGSSISTQTITPNTIYYIVVTGVNVDEYGTFSLQTYVF